MQPIVLYDAGLCCLFFSFLCWVMYTIVCLSVFLFLAMVYSGYFPLLSFNVLLVSFASLQYRFWINYGVYLWQWLKIKGDSSLPILKSRKSINKSQIKVTKQQLRKFQWTKKKKKRGRPDALTDRESVSCFTCFTRNSNPHSVNM